MNEELELDLPLRYSTLKSPPPDAIQDYELKEVQLVLSLETLMLEHDRLIDAVLDPEFQQIMRSIAVICGEIRGNEILMDALKLGNI